MDQEGLSGKVMATSYGHDAQGSLSLIGGRKGRRLLVIDEKITRRRLWKPPPSCTASSITVPAAGRL